MTVLVTGTSVKPSNVNFPEYDPIMEEHLRTHYINTGKILNKNTHSTKINETDHSLDLRVFTMEFDSAASYAEFKNDSICIESKARRSAYFAEHGITNTSSIEYTAPDVAPV